METESLHTDEAAPSGEVLTMAMVIDGVPYPDPPRPGMAFPDAWIVSTNYRVQYGTWNNGQPYWVARDRTEKEAREIAAHYGEGAEVSIQPEDW